ncbi:MAG TPA: hypothetical protein ENN40_05655 [Candidatus Aminicenantes bacterium]|nr:hypothetical protein [Candidatus Aminicenantes bacterium]
MAKKKKKQLRQRINPEKSNKMIYAVGGGLFVVMSMVLLLMLRSGEMPENPAEIMKSSLGYVEKTDGVLDVQTDAEAARVVIVYEPAERVNIVQVAQYAGVRVSHRLPDREVEIRLSRFRPENVEYQFWVLNGRVVRYKVVEGGPSPESLPTDSPLPVEPIK